MIGSMSKPALFLSALVAFAAWAVAAAAADFTSQTVTISVRKNMEAALFIPNGPGPDALPHHHRSSSLVAHS